MDYSMHKANIDVRNDTCLMYFYFHRSNWWESQEGPSGRPEQDGSWINRPCC